MQNFNIGDLVLIINSDYVPSLVGQAGIVVMAARNINGTDKFGNHLSGWYTVVDLPEEINRFGTTLWYFKPHYLLKISPDYKEKVLYQEQLI